ncbi:hypothetical protein Bca52824_051825 [Brassica carinata]|uniref:Glycosyltransferase n=1 Tax=Brassica carinata TaxID=52824 RepID=A0A8X7UI48_BRACI|nr:hypothetical protein Bca52824_051825 [Brassica carinata]
MVQKFHAFMFPWFAFGHMIPYLHLANKLAEKGHRVTFLLPKKAQKQSEHHNLFSDNILFHLLTIPPVAGLPAGAETASDIPISLGNFLFAAMDLTRDQVTAAVHALRPDLILFDFAYWVPEMAREHRVKSVVYNGVSTTNIAHNHVPGSELGVPPPGYPSAKRKVLLTGPMLPELDKSKPLEDQWSSWLTGFRQGSVVFCALGSQITLEKDQFQELCLEMELTGLPFLVAVTPPKGAKTIQEALPEGFEERVKDRGVVWGEWVQQPLILAHPSVGCFVSHCGFGSMWESLMSDCQIVLLPLLNDQILTTRLMTEELEVSVEVPREETGWFSKESLSAAIISVMDEDSELGYLVRRNHAKLKESLVSPGLLTGYTDKFVEALQDLVNDTNLD